MADEGEPARVREKVRDKVREEQLWQRYWRHGGIAVRNQLVEHYLPFARSVSLRLYRHWSTSEVPAEDFIQYGTLGLIESVERFRPGGNAGFKTYAAYRIKGAILNAVGKFSEYLDYSAYQRTLKKDRRQSLARHSTTAGTPFDKMLNITLNFAVSHIIEGLNTVAEDGLPGENPYRLPEEDCGDRQLMAQIDKLPERTQRIMKLHYFEGLTFTEVAQILGLSKAAVSYQHARGIEQLRRPYRTGNKIELSF